MAVRGSSWCAGRGVCELSDCRRSWFACEARGVRGCAGGSGSSSSRLCPSASTWHQLSRMQGPSSLPRKQKQRAKFKAKQEGGSLSWPKKRVAAPRSQPPDPTAQPPIILARMQTGRHCARVSAALLSILSSSQAVALSGENVLHLHAPGAARRLRPRAG